jgi:hypothetical protein
MKKQIKNKKKKISSHEFENKGQSEMFGLVFIVMLISVGLILVAQSEINKKPSDIKQNFEKSELATNTINTLIKTRTIGCNNQDLGDLYVDCGNNPSNPRIRCEDGTSSCDFARVTTDYIMRKTLGTWRKNYYFNATANDESIFVLTSGTVSLDELCPATNRKVETVPLPLKSGTMMIELWICN